MSDQPQHDREPSGGQKPPVFFIRYLPYLALSELSDVGRRENVACVTYQSKGIWWELCLLEEGNGDFASYDAQIRSICCLEELIV